MKRCIAYMIGAGVAVAILLVATIPPTVISMSRRRHDSRDASPGPDAAPSVPRPPPQVLLSHPLACPPTPLAPPPLPPASPLRERGLPPNLALQAPPPLDEGSLGYTQIPPPAEVRHSPPIDTSSPPPFKFAASARPAPSSPPFNFKRCCPFFRPADDPLPAPGSDDEEEDGHISLAPEPSAEAY